MRRFRESRLGRRSASATGRPHLVRVLQAEQPAGAPDQGAQEAVGELANKAKASVGDRPAEVADALAEAKQMSDAAGKALDADNTDAAAMNQKQTADSLDQAAEGLAEAIKAEKKKQQEQLAQQSKESGELADQAARCAHDAAPGVFDALVLATATSGHVFAEDDHVIVGCHRDVKSFVDGLNHREIARHICRLLVCQSFA